MPGTVDIYWASGEVRESHAQVLKAYFWPLLDDPVEGPQVGGFVYGTLCDYMGPQAGSCLPFAMVFVDTIDPAYRNHVGFSLHGSTACCDGDWYDAGRGAFALNYVRATLADEPPIGSHDGSGADYASPDECYANGWAYDPDTGAASKVHVYFDAPPGQPGAAGFPVTADLERGDLQGPIKRPP